MPSSSQLQQEIASVAERIRQLRELQHSQKHLPFIAAHIQEHIDRLETKMHELLRAEKLRDAG